MLQPDFSELHSLYGINFNEYHWIPKKRVSQAFIRNLVKSTRMGLNPNLSFRMTKICPEPGCINPWHYHITPLFTLPKDSSINEATLREIVDEIDLDKIALIGLKKYLDLYNDSQPSELLKIDMKTLKKAVEIKSLM